MKEIYEYYILNMPAKGMITRNVNTEGLSGEFNKLSQQGWEFVESQRIDSDGWTDTILFIFRRPLPQ